MATAPAVLDPVSTRILADAPGPKPSQPRSNGKPKAKPAKAKPKKKSDPEAKALAGKAQELARAAGLKSGYTPSEGRECLDRFTVIRSGQSVTVERDDGETAKLKLAGLKALLAGKPEPNVSAALRKLGTQKLYTRKLAAFLLAR